MSSPGPLLAVGFLTRLPVRVVVDDPADLGRGVKWFPVVGLGIGSMGGLAYLLVASLLPPVVAAAAAVGTTVAITGGFHEDGLADSFDGLSSTRTVAHQLEIMRDPRIGTFGALALVVTIAARIGLIAELEIGAAAVTGLAWVHGVSRAAAVAVMIFADAAAPGSGADHLVSLRPLGPAAMGAAVVLAGIPFLGTGSVIGSVLGAAVGAVGMSWWASRRLGGVTGDVLGACQQLALIGSLAGVVA